MYLRTAIKKNRRSKIPHKRFCQDVGYVDTPKKTKKQRKGSGPFQPTRTPKMGPRRYATSPELGLGKLGLAAALPHFRTAC
jgi:hypothetical protein